MPTEVIVAIIAVLGTALGSFGGIIASSKLTVYRLQQLEDKVNKHNGVIERTFILEGKCENICEKLVHVDNQLEKLEGFVIFKDHE